MGEPDVRRLPGPYLGPTTRVWSSRTTRGGGANNKGRLLFEFNPQDKVNLLIMTSRPDEIRNVDADFDATGRPMSVVLKVLSEGAKLTRLFYMRDFMETWYAFRTASRGHRRAADSMWWEICRQLVFRRVNAVMSGGFRTQASNLLPDSPDSSSEPPGEDQDQAMSMSLPVWAGRWPS